MKQRLTGRLRLPQKLMLVLALVLVNASVFADVQATVDRSLVSETDTIKLNVRVSGSAMNQAPDFSALNYDFDILGISNATNQSTVISNGQRTSISYKDHILNLKPNRLGTLTIPAIKVGRELTTPIKITVQQQSAAARQQMNQYVFFDTSVDTNDTYVQGQIIYSVKLFYADAVGGDFPQPPVIENAIIETIENEKRSESVVGGRRFYVLEKRYAIFPQRSGSLTIPREVFNGTLGGGGFFTQKQRINAVSQPHTVNVNRIPTSFSGENWIPAKALAIKESWTGTPPIFFVGEPINRTVTISAIGLSDSLLPQLGGVDVPNVKIYADPPITEKRVSEDGLNALQTTTIGIVPTLAGEITLPEIRIPWWNTQTNREEIALLPAATYQVNPSTGVTMTAPAVTIPLSPTVNATQVQGEQSWWQYVAFALGLLWLLSTWQWVSVRRQLAIAVSAGPTRFEPVFEDPDESRIFKTLTEAANRNRAADAHRQLILWVNVKYPGFDSLTHWSKQHPEIAKEITALEHQLFSGDDAQGWRGKNLIALLTRLRKSKHAEAKTPALQVALNPA